jgi:hypothetical protein
MADAVFSANRVGSGEVAAVPLGMAGLFFVFTELVVGLAESVGRGRVFFAATFRVARVWRVRDFSGIMVSDADGGVGSSFGGRK